MTRSLVKLFIASLVVAAFLASIITIATAAPAAPQPTLKRQPDGTVFFARTMGDEFVNWTATEDGYAIVKAPGSAQWRYAIPAPDGSLAPSYAVVGADDPALSGIQPNLAPSRAVDAYGAPVANTISRDDAYGAPEAGLGALMSPSRAASMAPPAMPFTAPVLVIMVDYGNETAEAGSATAITENTFGESFGSVKHFYDAVSGGKVAVTKVNESYGTANDGVVGFLRLGATHPNFAGAIGASAQALAKAAIEGSDPYVNFAAYDTNGNGVVSMDELTVVLMVAGGDASMGDPGNTIWPHRWGYSTSTQLDGKWINEYTMIAEKQGANFTAMGVNAHELGHAFMDWPDLYDTNGGSEGVGDFDLMAGGSWNSQNGEQPGATPAPPGAFLRAYSGFITPTPLTANSTNTIENTDNGSQIFKYENSATDYFLIENRNNTVGYDKGLFYTYGFNASAGGLLITHINESLISTCWDNNSCNDNQANYLVDIEEASGTQHMELWQNRGEANDTFYAANAASFNDTTTPNAKSRTGVNSGLLINAVSAAGASMTFNNGTPAAPSSTISITDAAFGTVSTDTAAPTISLTVTNTGTTTLTADNVSLVSGNTGDFAITAETCTAGALAASATCTVTVSATPVAEGARSATLTAAFTNPAGDSVTADASLSMTGQVGNGAWDNATAAASSTTVGETSSLDVSFSNSGSADISITGGVSLSGANAGDFSVSATTCTDATIAPAASCTATISFAPAATGTRTATLALATSDPDTPAPAMTVSGIGLAPAADITLSTTTLTMGGVTVGSSTAATVTVDNDGGQDLTIGTVTLSGAHASDFSTAPGFNDTVIAPGGSASLTITFSPSATGARGATVTIPSDDPIDPSVTVNVSGTGNPTAADIDLSITTHDFGTKTVGSSTAASVTMENLGMAILTVSGISLTGSDADQFSVNGDCVTSISGGTSCTETVSFTPDTPGTFSASAVITSSDPDEPTVSVALTGTATATPEPNIVISAASIDFGDATTGSTQQSVITITNNGDADLSINDLSITGSSAFTIDTDTCSAPVSPAAACTVTAGFTPATDGAHAATISITSNDPDASITTIPLTGTAAPADVTLHTVTATTGIGGTITPAGAVSIADGGGKTFTVTPDAGYIFFAASLSNGNAALSINGDTVTVTNVSGNVSLNAVFAAVTTDGDTTTLTITTDPGAAGGGCSAAGGTAGGETLALITLLSLFALRLIGRRKN